MRVGVLGLGTMGGRVAAALTAAGHEVRGWDPVEAACTRAESQGVTTVREDSEAVSGAEVVILSVPAPADVLSAVDGPLEGATGLVVDLSTIDPGTAREAARRLAARGVDYVDAPVLGRPERIGHWTLPTGGSEEAVERARALLEGPVAGRIVRVGDVGSGSTVKVLNNLMFGAINAVTAEALNACALAGVDPAVFVAAIADSGAATVSNLFRELAPKMLANDYAPSFQLGLLAKDNALALALASEVGAAAPLAETIVRINGEALALGHAMDDTGAVQELYRARSTRRARQRP